MRYRTLLAPLLLVALAVPAQAAPPPVPREARWGATWLAARVTPGGYVAALDGKPDVAGSVVAGLALAAAGVAPRTVDAIATYASQHVDDYARSGTADRPGALGRLALLAAASGRDPNAFGGTAPANHLIDRILATQVPVGPEAGLFRDPTYNGLFSHSLGLLGVATARTLTSDQRTKVSAAVEYLATQQCADGGWQNAPRLVVAGITLTPCGSGANGPDTNVAGFAAQALAAHRRQPRADALAWFDAAQNDAGGWGYLPRGATDADSTGIVVQAILALGGDPASARFTAGGRTAYAALLGLQLGCAAPVGDRGAFAYMRGADGTLRANFYATAEAVPAVARRPFPLTRPAATVARASYPCTR